MKDKEEWSFEDRLKSQLYFASTGLQKVLRETVIAMLAQGVTKTRIKEWVDEAQQSMFSKDTIIKRKEE